jgi:hypothetical protein
MIPLILLGWSMSRLFAVPLILGSLGIFLLLSGVLRQGAIRRKPQSVSSAFDLNFPPPGAWFSRSPGGFTAGAVIRNPQAYVLAFIALVFLVGAIALYPNRASFLVLLFGLLVLYGTLRSAVGRVRLTVDLDRLTIFTGIGRIGSSMTHEWSSFQTVREEETEENASLRIVLEGTKRAQFGQGLSNERRTFLVNVLRTMLPPHRTKTVAATTEVPASPGKSMQRTCPNCGALLPADTVLCAVCGKRVQVIPARSNQANLENDWSVPPELLIPVPRPVRGNRVTPYQWIFGIVFVAGITSLVVWVAGFFIGACWIAMAASWGYRVVSEHKRLLKWGKPARAVVVEATRMGGGRTPRYYSTSFEYQDDTGDRIRSSPQRLGVELAVGSVMTVLYDPKKPSTCVMYPMDGLEIALPQPVGPT